jgi:hypothetical protein
MGISSMELTYGPGRQMAEVKGKLGTLKGSWSINVIVEYDEAKDYQIEVHAGPKKMAQELPASTSLPKVGYAISKFLNKHLVYPWEKAKTQKQGSEAEGQAPKSGDEKGKSGDQKAYRAYFEKMLKKWKVKSPKDLDDAKKKKFFEEVDKGWKSKKEGAAPFSRQAQGPKMVSVLERLQKPTKGTHVLDFLKAFDKVIGSKGYTLRQFYGGAWELEDPQENERKIDTSKALIAELTKAVGAALLKKAFQAGMAAMKSPLPEGAVTEPKGQKDPQIAKTILQQLGGAGRLKAMLGAKNFIDHGNGLSFQFPNPKRNRGNYFKVTLDKGSDTYILEIGKRVKYDYKKLKEWKGIHADQMKPIFEKFTGLRLSL